MFLRSLKRAVHYVRVNRSEELQTTAQSVFRLTALTAPLWKGMLKASCFVANVLNNVCNWLFSFSGIDVRDVCEEIYGLVGRLCEMLNACVKKKKKKHEFFVVFFLKEKG